MRRKRDPRRRCNPLLDTLPIAAATASTEWIVHSGTYHRGRTGTRAGSAKGASQPASQPVGAVGWGWIGRYLSVCDKSSDSKPFEVTNLCVHARALRVVVVSCRGGHARACRYSARSKLVAVPRKWKHTRLVTALMPSFVVSTRAVWAWRLVLLAVILAFVTHHDVLSGHLQALWTDMRVHPVIVHDSFEPLVASASFATWINMFRVWDRFIPYFRRFRLTGNVKPDTLLGFHHGMQALVAYLLPLLVFDAFVKRRRLPEQAPSAAGLLLQVAASIFVYDFLFFWVHLALHKFRMLGWIHTRHHTKSPMNASEVVRHSLLDGALQVVCNIVTLNALRSHPLSRMLHNVVITYMLTETHSGCVRMGMHRCM